MTQHSLTAGSCLGPHQKRNVRLHRVHQDSQTRGQGERRGLSMTQQSMSVPTKCLKRNSSYDLLGTPQKSYSGSRIAFVDPHFPTDIENIKATKSLFFTRLLYS